MGKDLQSKGLHFDPSTFPEQNYLPPRGGEGGWGDDRKVLEERKRRTNPQECLMLRLGIVPYVSYVLGQKT